MKHLTSFESFVNESAFHAALANAKKQGLKEFEFQGKKYPVHEDAMDESSLNEATADENIAKLSDEALMIMCDTFNDYHKNAKGKLSDNDMAFLMKLYNEKAKRKLK
jgi:hypothetical protein